MIHPACRQICSDASHQPSIWRKKDESLSSLLGKTQLVFPVGCSYRRILEDLTATQSAVPAGAIEFNSLGAIIASVSAGLGVSLFPKSVVALYSERESLT